MLKTGSEIWHLHVQKWWAQRCPIGALQGQVCLQLHELTKPVSNKLEVGHEGSWRVGGWSKGTIFKEMGFYIFNWYLLTTSICKYSKWLLAYGRVCQVIEFDDIRWWFDPMLVFCPRKIRPWTYRLKHAFSGHASWLPLSDHSTLKQAVSVHRNSTAFANNFNLLVLLI